MVNFRDPAVVTQTKWIRVKFWHVLFGIYFWEFFTTLDYEWRVIRGRIPYRWTLWIYLFTRLSALMSTILCIVALDSATPINCRPWFTTVLVFSYLPVASAQLLILLRAIAIWNRNKAVMATTTGLWVINSAFLIQGTIELRSEWETDSCAVVNSTRNTLSVISIAITDISLLLIMLLGLLRARNHGGGFGLTSLLLKQGVIWILLAAIAEVPPAVLIVLNLNDDLNIMFQVSSLVTMAIAGTRMHRSLVDFASKSPETGHDSYPASRLAFSKSKRTGSVSIPIQVTLDVEQHPTPQMSVHRSESSIDTKVEMHEKQDGLHAHHSVEGDT